jgi:hypothetical protein
VPLDTSAVVAFSKEATANPKMSCILNIKVLEKSGRGKNVSREDFLAVQA